MTEEEACQDAKQQYGAVPMAAELARRQTTRRVLCCCLTPSRRAMCRLVQAAVDGLLTPAGRVFAKVSRATCMSCVYTSRAGNCVTWLHNCILMSNAPAPDLDLCAPSAPAAATPTRGCSLCSWVLRRCTRQLQWPQQPLQQRPTRVPALAGWCVRGLAPAMCRSLATAWDWNSVLRHAQQ
jgi:hypothetical protein